MDMKTFLQKVEQKYSNQPEFLQAVTEVMTSLEDFLAANPKYQEESLLERLVEPERAISFRVTREDDQGKIQVNT
jgi:glutamate dehydrogenase (NADP+)